jgi:hypothetical protein
MPISKEWLPQVQGPRGQVFIAGVEPLAFGNLGKNGCPRSLAFGDLGKYKFTPPCF